jgi:hypothetical protein
MGIIIKPMENSSRFNVWLTKGDPENPEIAKPVILEYAKPENLEIALESIPTFFITYTQYCSLYEVFAVNEMQRLRGEIKNIQNMYDAYRQGVTEGRLKWTKTSKRSLAAARC